MRTKLVVAGNNWQFRDWTSARQEDVRAHCVEVKTVSHLQGWEHCEVHFVGSWRERRDAVEVEQEAIRRKNEGRFARLIYWAE